MQAFGGEELILEFARDAFDVGGIEFAEAVGDEHEVHVRLANGDDAEEAGGRG